MINKLNFNKINKIVKNYKIKILKLIFFKLKVIFHQMLKIKALFKNKDLNNIQQLIFKQIVDLILILGN
jgi:hypothetical protein